jgi:hypothetical protein
MLKVNDEYCETVESAIHTVTHKVGEVLLHDKAVLLSEVYEELIGLLCHSTSGISFYTEQGQSHSV